MDRHLGVGLEAQSHATSFDLENRDLKGDLQIFGATDDHAFAIFSRQHQHGGTFF